MFQNLISKLTDPKTIKQFVAYAAIGFSGLFWEVLIIYVMRDMLSINTYIANTVGMLVGMLNNFFLNAIFNFKSTDRLLARFVPYILIWFGLLLLSNAIIKVFYEEVGINFWLVKVFSIGVVTVSGFFLHRNISFRKHETHETKTH